MSLQSFFDLQRASHMQRIVPLRMVCLVAGCFFSRTVPSDSAVFQPLEDVIRQVFIPAMTGSQLP